MMTDQIILKLENAADIIMASPNLVSKEQRQVAESIFLEFRQSKAPYGICKEILDNSQNHYVMFESAEVLKGAVIREWAFLLNSDKSSLRQYLLQYITTNNVPSFVRDKLLQVLAIMVKRASIDDNVSERTNILSEVENLIINAEPSKKILGCNIIINLMQEYATTVKSTDVGLAWEVHFAAKKQFEATDLKRILQLCVYLLAEVVKSDPPYSDTLIQLTGYLLKITETVFTWGYVSAVLPKRLIGIYESVYESDAPPALKLTTSWSDVILNPDLLPLMFQIYWKVRDSDQLAHHSLNCLVQLASLTGPIISTDNLRIKYLHLYLITFFKLISNVTIKSKESLGISNIVKKLTIFFIHEMPKLPESLQNTLFDEFTRLTCHFCDGAVLEEAQGEEDKYYGDAFDNMLEAWMTIIQEYNNSFDDNNFLECAKQILNKYIQSHLAPPDGCRQIPAGEPEEVEDNEDNDRVCFKDQLQAIGVFGRVVPGHVLPILFKLLEGRINELVNNFGVMQTRAMNMSEAASLDNLFEDIHWIVLIAGHILCMDSDGETPMIPAEIMQYSMGQAARNETTSTATMNAIRALQSRSPAPDDFDRCDHGIRIAFSAMRLCTIEDCAASVNMAQFLSPEVGSTLMWFLKRWCLSYLLPVESYYQEVVRCAWFNWNHIWILGKLSPILVGCLGKDTDGARFIVDFILSKIRSNIYNFKSEPILLRDTVDLLCDTVCIKHKSTYIVKTEGMRNLMDLYRNLEPGCLPPNIIRGLCKGFARAGAALHNPRDADSTAAMNEYYETFLTPLQQRFKSLLGQENFPRTCHEEAVQKQLVDVLESFIGVAKGALMPTTATLFHFLAPVLSDLSALLTIYSNYQVIVQLVLELLGQTAKYMLCYLSPFDSKRLYESSLATVRAYAKCNAGRFTGQIQAERAEEFSFQDLGLVLDLLTFILSKDCFDLCTDGADEEINVTASDVSLFGLHFVMPLMTDKLLQFPSLCTQYYRLLVLINDIYPEKICNLPQQLLHDLLRSIETGLTNFGPDIVQACLDFVQGMATYIFRHSMLNTPFAQALRRFLTILIELTLSHQINSDLIGTASTSIYALMCCYQDDYEMLVYGLIRAQPDPITAERLAAAFSNLVANVSMTCDRLPKLKFRDNFDKFVANVHGFLLIK